MQNENTALFNIAEARIARVDRKLTLAIKSACCNAGSYRAPDVIFTVLEAQEMTDDLACVYALLRAAAEGAP